MKPQNRTVQVGPRSGVAAMRSATFDEKKGTVEVLATTGERVLRPGYDQVSFEPYWEELSLDAGAVRMQRIQSGRLNLIDNHGMVDGNRWGGSRYASDVVLGVVEEGSCKLTPGAMTCTVRLSNREEIAGKRQDIREGILASCSLSYRIWNIKLIEQAADGLSVYRAIDWEPLELSITAVPAEAGAHVRNAAENNPCTVVDQRTDNPKRNRMEPDEVAPAGAPTPADRSGAPAPGATPTPTPAATPAARAAAPAPAPAPAQNVDEAVERALGGERSRLAEIETLGTRARLDRSVIDEIKARTVNGKVLTIDQARAEILAKWSAGDSLPATLPSGVVGVSSPGRASELDSMRDAILHRGLSSLYPMSKLSEQARSFVGFSMLDMARHCLERTGERVRGMDKHAIVQRAFHSTSDFPALLANTANKSLRDQYEVMPNTWKTWTRTVSFNDFKTHSRVQMSGAPALELVPEGGAVQRGAISEQVEQYALKTWAKIVAITRQAIINDDLGAFTRIPSQFAISASTKIEDLVYDVMTTNANMADAVALFHATHANVGTGAGSALAIAGLSAARARLRAQLGLDGKYLNLTGAYLLVPAALETTAQQLMVPYNAAVATQINPFVGSLKLVVQPRLDGVSGGTTRWWIICDPATCDTVEVAFLDGMEGPRLETEAGFDVEGLKIKCVLDVNAKAIDWRGMDRSAGV